MPCHAELHVMPCHLVDTRSGKGPLGRSRKFRVLVWSWYPGTSCNSKCCSKVTRTRTASCMAKFRPTQDLAPAEKASMAFRLPAGMVPVVSEGGRSIHLLEGGLVLSSSLLPRVFDRMAHRSGRKDSACGNTWLS